MGDRQAMGSGRDQQIASVGPSDSAQPPKFLDHQSVPENFPESTGHDSVYIYTYIHTYTV